ncbi:MAG: MFS transporter [Congregibacter sp.]
MNYRLISLVSAPFAFGTSAFAFVGLMDPMAADLQIGVPLVGQLQTVFALACAVGGPLLAKAFSRVDRKRLLLTVMLLLCAMSACSALADSFTMLASIRVAGGLFAALSLPLASTIAIQMVPEEKRPGALALVLAGYTLAFMIGTPVATLIGNSLGWEYAFWFAAAISFTAVLFIAVGAPANIAAPSMEGISFTQAARGDNLRLMVITLLGFSATFASVSYIGPVITAFAGLTGSAIGGVQVAVGIGSLLGLPAGAWLAKLPPRKALGILFVVMLLTQTMFSYGMLRDLGSLAIPALGIIMATGAGALFATSPVIQTVLAKNAGPAATLAFALNGSMIYLGQGMGASIGGAVTAGSSIAWVGCAGAVVAVLGLILTTRLSK